MYGQNVKILDGLYQTRTGQQKALDLDFIYNHEVADGFSFVLKSLKD